MLTGGRAGGFLPLMRTLLMVFGVVMLAGVVGCGHKRVKVANTPEGNACNRQCMEMFNGCYDGKRKNLKTCQARENDCLRTCPGAPLNDGGEESLAPSQSNEVAPEATALSAGASCRAEELPEWKGASALEKRDLLARCRAPAEQATTSP